MTTLDRISNREKNRGTMKVGEISKKVQEPRLKWYGHATIREDGYVRERVMMIDVTGKRIERSRCVD